MKKCSRCGEEKDISEFSKDKYTKSGIDCYCRKCKDSFYRGRVSKNKNYHIDRYNNFTKKRVDSWREYFKKQSTCQVCGTKISYASGDAKTSIHFDHRNGGDEIIRYNPTTWLSGRMNTLKNRSIWESCSFGILCRECNKSIPTKNRKEWLLNVTRYINNISNT